MIDNTKYKFCSFEDRDQIFELLNSIKQGFNANIVDEPLSTYIYFN
jgi:hypothetical protein